MRKLLVLIVFALAALAASIGPLFLQDEPLLETMPPPAPEDVAATRQLVRGIRAAAGADRNTRLQTTPEQLNSALRLGARFIDGFRGRITVEPQDVLGQVSVPVPWWRGQKWLNISGRVPEFDGQLTLTEITVGSTDIPPALAIAVARLGANLGLGNRFGDRVLQAASAMAIEGETLTFRLALDDMGRNGVMRGAFGTLRGAEMPGPEEIESYHRKIRAAMADGTLPQSGSFLPYIRFTLRAALDNSTADTLPNAYTAAIFGLAKACGSREFAVIVGRLAFDVADVSEDWTTSCEAMTLNGRVDSRLHFLISAALQAASNRGFSVAIGEFKELYDTLKNSGGFDFTDMAANLSGIRLSNVMMATPRKDWPARLALLETENDAIVSFEGIPHLMSDTEFAARYGDIDSPAYRETISRIEARIDRLDFYRTP